MFVDRLPRASHLHAAQSRDVEAYAAYEAEQKGKPRPPSPPPPATEFSPDVEILAALYDRIGELIKVSVAAAGSKKQVTLAPWPRPETARDILRRRKVQENVAHLEQVIVFMDEPVAPDPASPVVSRIRR